MCLRRVPSRVSCLYLSPGEASLCRAASRRNVHKHREQERNHRQNVDLMLILVLGLVVLFRHTDVGASLTSGSSFLMSDFIAVFALSGGDARCFSGGGTGCGDAGLRGSEGTAGAVRREERVCFVSEGEVK